MKKSRLSFLLMLLMGAFTLTSCGDNDADTDNDTADSTADADAGDDAEEMGDGPGAQVKSATFKMMEEMVEISEGIETVEDAEEARPKIAEAVGGIIVIYEAVAANASTMTAEEKAALQTEMQSLQATMMQDPKFKELAERGAKAQAEMQQKSPEAAAAFEGIVNEEMGKMMQAMGTLMMGNQAPPSGADPNAAPDASADTTK